MQDIVEPAEQARKCPKCGANELYFDKKIGVLRCRKCGFEQKIAVIK
jgi:ribosomal protein L37AE/L43A